MAKTQIRRGVYETNSSSTHSLTMCSNDQFEKWKNGEVLYWKWDDKFGTKEEIIAKLKLKPYYSGVNWDDEDEVYDIFADNGIVTYAKFMDMDEFETYVDRYTTPGGETVVAFGYYGYC